MTTNRLINNIITSWTKCYNNHIFIENKNNETIVIDGKDSNNKTFYIENTNNSAIYCNTKINHLVINKCNNINLFINSNFISGLDIFHSNNVYIFSNISGKSEYSLNFGENYTINFNAEELDITLCVNSIYNLLVNKLTPDKTYKTFTGCLNLFSSEPIFFFINDKSEEVYGFDTVYGKCKLDKK